MRYDPVADHLLSALISHFILRLMLVNPFRLEMTSEIAPLTLSNRSLVA